MATFNSRPGGPTNRKLAAAGLFLLTGFLLVAGEDQKKIFAARAETEFHLTQMLFQSDPNNATNAWQFARASYDLADFATNDTERANIANQAI